VEQSPPTLFFKVSILSHNELCDNRSRLETFYPKNSKFSKKGKGAIAEGNKLHFLYSSISTDFEREVVKANLDKFTKLSGNHHKIFSKRYKDVEITGMYDDLQIITQGEKTFTSLLELKTTSKPYMSFRDIRVAIRQLQLYMWLLKDLLEELGYPLWQYGYVEVFSQKTYKKLRSFPVKYDPHIEEWLDNVIEKLKGRTRLVGPTSLKICFSCPMRDSCNLYYTRRVENGKIR